MLELNLFLAVLESQVTENVGAIVKGRSRVLFSVVKGHIAFVRTQYNCDFPICDLFKGDFFYVLDHPRLDQV